MKVNAQKLMFGLGISVGLIATQIVAKTSKDELSRTAKRMNSFGWSLFEEASKIKDIVESSENENGMILSPVSAYYAFGLLANGAVGESQLELTNLLAKDFEGIENENFEEKVISLMNKDLKSYSEYLKNSIGKSESLSLANRAWFNTRTVQVVPEYVAAISNSFSSFSGEEVIVSTEFEPTDIAAEINGWVKKATLDMIDGVVSPDDFQPEGDVEPAFSLVNALVYQGKWPVIDGYDLYNSKDLGSPELYSFKNKNGTTKEVDLVSDRTHVYAKIGELDAISLPLASLYDKENYQVEEGNYTVDIVRVPAGKSNRLSYQVYSSLVRSLKKNSLDPNLHNAKWYVPVAKLKSKIDLRQTLEDGFQLSTIFSAQDANFSKMVTPKPTHENPFVKFARQDAVLEFDQYGVKAAAVTVIGGGVGIASTPVYTVTFVVNSPYFMAIRDKTTDAVLFMAAVDNL